MGDELRVDTNDLRAKANEIDGLHWASPAEQSAITPPSALRTSQDAIANLAKNAQSVWEYQNWGFNESKRLSQSLYHVGKAYDEVDLRAKSEINAGKSISSGPVKPDDCTLPSPAHPSPPGAPSKPGHHSGDPEEIEHALSSGDQGAALRSVAEFWRTTGKNLQTAAHPFHARIRNWEGAAAENAYGRFNSFGGWLQELSGTWDQLAGEADKIHQAHTAARSAHTPIYDQWMASKKQLETADDDQKQGIMVNLAHLYADSEHVRAQYESDAMIDRVQPPEPQSGDLSSVPVYTNGDPRRPAAPADEGESPSQPTGGPGGSPGGPGGGGGSPEGAPPPTTASPAAAQSAQQATPQQSPAAQSGGSPSGESGGSPSGGSPGGGMPGGLPAAAKASPHLPTGPSVKPASKGGGGAGAGGGGGAGPLQPAVTGSAVAPAHAPAAQGAEAGKGAMAAPAGAGMGGGAPMGGQGGHGQGGKEKRRTPGLSPDEELYKEDRAWTEGIIGNRRRREVQDAKDTGDSE